MYEGQAKWLYDKTGIDAFNDARIGASMNLNTANQFSESDFGRNNFELETGDYMGVLNPKYLAHTIGSSLPYMANGMALGYATGGLATDALIGLGLSEGVGTAIALSNNGRMVQKVIAGMGNAGFDAFQNMQANYNDLVKEGYSVQEADKISKEAFWRELPVTRQVYLSSTVRGCSEEIGVAFRSI